MDFAYVHAMRWSYSKVIIVVFKILHSLDNGVTDGKGFEIGNIKDTNEPLPPIEGRNQLFA